MAVFKTAAKLFTVNFIVDMFRYRFPIICCFVDTWVTPYIPLQNNQLWANYKLFKELFFIKVPVKSAYPVAFLN
jgi:hypothetical protein